VSQTQNKITICQSGYIREVLQRFQMEDCKPVRTPIATGTKLVASPQRSTVTKQYPFRELIGALMYIATCTRPDISHAINLLSQFNNSNDESHWQAAKRVLRYLKGTIEGKLTFSKDELDILGYVDSDWGNCDLDRRSYTGYSFILCGAAISWCSRKQRTVALSSTEAEYMGLTEAAKEAIFLSTFVQELGVKQLSKITIFNDNQSAGKLAQNPVFHSRSKHISIRHHFIRNALLEYPLTLEYLCTEEMMADIFTKPLCGPKHELCRDRLGLLI